MLLVVRWPAGLIQVTEIVSPGRNRARTTPSRVSGRACAAIEAAFAATGRPPALMALAPSMTAAAMREAASPAGETAS